MLGKLKKVPVYGKNVLLFLVLYLPARILRRVNPSYRGLWLVSERGFDARDNGYWFFRYLREKHSDINSCFVITPDSPDRDRVACLGKTVRFQSIRHYLMFLAADVLVGTHLQPAAPDLWVFFHLSQWGFREKGLRIFLQHGVIKDDMTYLHYPTSRMNIFVCGARPEYEYVSSTYGHPEGVVRYLGLCRFDNLPVGGAHEREILVMPTWRGAFYPSGDAFVNTPFFKHFQALLNAPELSELLEKLDYKLIFYPHIELQKELHHFTSPSERIILADCTTHDVQDLLIRCSLLITDYSSVFNDVAYMNKPVIYYQFDWDDYRSRLYAEGYFSYEKDGFGPVVKTQTELLSALNAAAESGFEPVSPYRERIEAFYPLHDRQNCERTFRAIEDLMRN